MKLIMSSEDVKPNLELIKTEPVKEAEQRRDVPLKSSMEILSELFECFDAKPPVIVKKEKEEHDKEKKKKKSKKKHKHKDKKHKKKDKKRKRNNSSTSSDSVVDLADILVKQDNIVKKDVVHKKIKIEGLDDDQAIEIKTEVKIKTEKGTEEETATTKTSDDKDRTVKTNKTKHRSRTRSKERKEKEKEKLKTHKAREKSRERERKSLKRSRSNDFYKPREKVEDDFYKARDRSDRRTTRVEDSHKSKSRRRSRSPDKRRDRRSRSCERKKPKIEEDFYKASREKYNRQREKHYKERIDYIDKKKLLEIARKNAIVMMKSGSLPGALTLGPQAQEKVIAAIKAGGKTIEELTDFCKTLSKQEELGELSSGPEENGSDVETGFHHPFQIKDRPTSITMNIKNSVPLPLKSTQERSTELRMQFPVSSGQLHRKTESEWVPVSPKTAEDSTEPPDENQNPVGLLAIEAPPPKPKPAPVAAPETVAAVAPQTNDSSTIDIGSIVSQRLTAIRKLQENPNDVQALTEMYKSNKEMQSWAQSKQQPGQFTGTTGANILSAAELSSGYQAWARKDQLQTATPVSGGMGMHLLQKMGWKPGEGLGKEKTGALEPLLLEVKLDKKGLVANEEQKKKRTKPHNNQQTASKALQSKHPVSLLGEFASKKKLGAPEYTLCFECGPDHKKNFLFKVTLNGVEYKPNIASPNKKEAKAAAASVCLQQIGLLPTVSS